MPVSRTELATKALMAHAKAVFNQGSVGLDQLDAQTKTSIDADRDRQLGSWNQQLAGWRAQLAQAHAKTQAGLTSAGALANAEATGKAAAGPGQAPPPPQIPTPQQMNPDRPQAGFATDPLAPLFGTGSPAGGQPAMAGGNINPVGGATAQQALQGMSQGMPSAPMNGGQPVLAGPQPGPAMLPGGGAPQPMPGGGQPGAGAPPPPGMVPGPVPGAPPIPAFNIGARTSTESGFRDFAGTSLPSPTTRTEATISPNTLTAGEAAQYGLGMQRLGWEQQVKLTDALATAIAIPDPDHPENAAQALAMAQQLPPTMRARLQAEVGAQRSEDFRKGEMRKVVGPDGQMVWARQSKGIEGMGARPETEVKVNVANILPDPNAPNAKTIGAFQERAQQLTGTVNDVNQIIKGLSPANFSLGPKLGAAVLSTVERMAPGTIDAIYGKGAADQVAQFKASMDKARAWVTANVANNNNVRMSPEQREEIIKNNFSPDMTYGEAMARLKDLKNNAELSLAQANIFAHGGFGDRQMQRDLATADPAHPEDLYNKYPLSDIQQRLMDEVRVRAREMRTANPKLSEDDSTTQALTEVRQKHGIAGK